MRRSFIVAAAFAGLVAGGSGYVLAQSAPHGHGTQAAQSASTRAFIAANDRMHRDMAIQYSGNADRDFVAGMIPHHQGAIDMARAVLQYGHDPEVKAMAQAIIAAQEKEITEMRAMLARLPAH